MKEIDTDLTEYASTQLGSQLDMELRTPLNNIEIRECLYFELLDNLDTKFLDIDAKLSIKLKYQI